jgi:NitT/TauT family transport system permease protein
MRRALARIGGTLAQWVVAIAVVYGAWRLVVSPQLPPGFSASPEEVLTKLRSWFSDGTAWDMIGRTLGEALTGLAIGSCIGIAIALALGFSHPVVERFFEPFIGALYAMPKFVLVPVLFVWIGAGFTPRMVIIAVGTVPIVAIYTLSGIRTVDPDRVRMMRLFGARGWQVVGKLLVPHTAGHIATGLTLALPHAMFVAIGAEILFGGDDGIGGVLNTQAQLFDAPAVFGALTIATVLSVVLLAVLRLVSRRLLGVDLERARPAWG